MLRNIIHSVAEINYYLSKLSLIEKLFEIIIVGEYAVFLAATNGYIYKFMR
jgi:hypothetical protein